MTVRNVRLSVFCIVLTASCLLPGCAPAATAPPTPVPPAATAAATDTLPPTRTPTAKPLPTATRIPLPVISWNTGDGYFSLSGESAFLFSRNPAGWKPEDWETIAKAAHGQGNHFLRISTSSAPMGGDHGCGYTSDGNIVRDWTENWEHFFDAAEAEGLYMLPTFSG
jgi:hypothetical protein